MVSVPSIGEKFPEIEVVTTHGKIKLPEHYRGRWFVLFSHPADFTPVCTTEFIAFAKRYEDFRRLNAELIGLSIDSVFSHIQWIRWMKEKLGVDIPFPVIADPCGEIASKLGLLHAQSSTHTVRAVFIVDPDGVIRALLFYPQEVGRNINEILRLLKALQISREHGVAIPANWPNNELIESRAIIPPPRTVQEAEDRMKKYQCIDWWLCHEELPEDEIEEVLKLTKQH